MKLNALIQALVGAGCAVASATAAGDVEAVATASGNETVVAKAGTVDAFTANVRGMGRLVITLADDTRLPLEISLSRGGWGGGGVQYDEHRFVSYTERVHAKRNASKLPQADPYSNCVVDVSCKAAGISTRCYLLPYFNLSMGLYAHEDVVKFMPAWRKANKLAPDREYRFDFVPEPARARQLVYLDGSLLGAIASTNAVVGVAAERGLGLLSAGVSRRRTVVGFEELAPVAGHADGPLMRDAKLSIKPGQTVVGGIPMTVWAPNESVDSGRYRPITGGRTITWSPLYTRTPWQTGPEFAQWRVPNRAWRYAWILCADVPRKGMKPVVGTWLSKLGTGCTVSNMSQDETSLDAAATNADIRTVGTLAYRSGGKTVETPLYLVRQRLEWAKLGARMDTGLALDFEFVGTGPQSAARSSVQIFGCTLEPAPYRFTVANPVRGNIFEQGADEQVGGFDLTALLDGVKGTYEYETYDPLFRPLDAGTNAFAIARAGETLHEAIDLARYGLGWYGRDYVFRDADGAVVARHRTSFCVLAPDDREAGYESPYAAWPHLNGYHGANTNRIEQLECMRKAGFRTTWHPPFTNEALLAKWKVTKSVFGMGFHNPGKPPASPEELSNRLDKAIAAIRRDVEAFPHCRNVMLLHETWGINVCDEVANGVPGVREPYRGWIEGGFGTTNGNYWMVYFCTEYAKRLRKEFPHLKIVLGNGSGTSERIAQLAHDGLDLNLVDQLGIECKGFASLPECYGNRESPAELWALNETGRAFGFSNLTVNACNEYVFRTERDPQRTWKPQTILMAADYCARDYLISLAWGCDVISSGHLEDVNDAYYDTNWGAAGLCKFYPFSYPKRIYTALAVLTRVLDKPVFTRALHTGANSVYALEFRRDRSTRDFATAFWTPHYGATVEATYPAGAKLVRYAMFGTSEELKPDAAGTVRLDVGSSPCYVVSSLPAVAAKAVAFAPPELLPAEARHVTDLGTDAFTVPDDLAGVYAGMWIHVVTNRDPWGVPYPIPGKFAFRDATSEFFAGKGVELELVREGRVPEIRWENTFLRLKTPRRFRRSEVSKFLLYVKGNGSMAGVQLVFADPAHPEKRWRHVNVGDERGFIAFNGWQLLEAVFPKDGSFLGDREYDGVDEVELVGVDCGSARRTLDPIRMTDVVGNVAIGPVYVVPKSGDAK